LLGRRRLLLLLLLLLLLGLLRGFFALLLRGGFLFFALRRFLGGLFALLRSRLRLRFGLFGGGLRDSITARAS